MPPAAVRPDLLEHFLDREHQGQTHQSREIHNQSLGTEKSVPNLVPEDGIQYKQYGSA